MAEQSTAITISVNRVRQIRANAIKKHMGGKSLHWALTSGNPKRLARTCGEEVAEAIADWVGVVREELRDNGRIPPLALAFAELVRRQEQAEKKGMEDLAQVVRKRLIECAAAVLRAEDRSHSGSNGGSRSAIARPQGRKRQLKIR